MAKNVLSLNNKYSAQQLLDAINSGKLFKMFHDQAIDTVLFESNYLGSLDIESLSKFSGLFQGTNIKTLYLGHNQIGFFNEQKLMALFAGLEHSSVNKLHINNNNIGEEGAPIEPLLSCLSKMQLVQLDLSNNAIAGVGMNGLQKLINTVKNSNIYAVDIKFNRFENLIYNFQLYLLTNFFMKTTEGLSIENKHAIESYLSEPKVRNIFIESARLTTLLFLHIWQTMPKSDDDFKNSCNNSLLQELEASKQAVDEIFKQLKNKYSLETNFNDADILLEYSINYPTKMEDYPPVLHDMINSLNETLIYNRLKQQSKTSLQGLVMFSIYNSNINWKTASISNDLKEEFSKCNFLF